MVHPERPSPVGAPDIQFRSIVINDDEPRSFVAMDRKDAGELASWIEDVAAFVKKQNNLLCFYRKELEEDVCTVTDQ